MSEPKPKQSDPAANLPVELVHQVGRILFAPPPTTSLLPPGTFDESLKRQEAAAAVQRVTKNWTILSNMGAHLLYRYPYLRANSYAGFAETISNNPETEIATLTLVEGPKDVKDLYALRDSLLSRRSDSGDSLPDSLQSIGQPTANDLQTSSPSSYPSPSVKQPHLRELILGHDFMAAMAKNKSLVSATAQFLKEVDTTVLRYPRSSAADLKGIVFLSSYIRSTAPDATLPDSKTPTKIIVSMHPAAAELVVPSLPWVEGVQVEYRSEKAYSPAGLFFDICERHNIRWTFVDYNGNMPEDASDVNNTRTRNDRMRESRTFWQRRSTFPRNIAILTPSELQAAESEKERGNASERG